MIFFVRLGHQAPHALTIITINCADRNCGPGRFYESTAASAAAWHFARLLLTLCGSFTQKAVSEAECGKFCSHRSTSKTLRCEPKRDAASACADIAEAVHCDDGIQFFATLGRISFWTTSFVRLTVDTPTYRDLPVQFLRCSLVGRVSTDFGQITFRRTTCYPGAIRVRDPQVPRNQAHSRQFGLIRPFGQLACERTAIKRLGWPTGLEPATARTTIWGSTIELWPPSLRTLKFPRPIAKIKHWRRESEDCKAEARRVLSASSG